MILLIIIHKCKSENLNTAFIEALSQENRNFFMMVVNLYLLLTSSNLEIEFVVI